MDAVEREERNLALKAVERYAVRLRVEATRLVAG